MYKIVIRNDDMDVITKMKLPIIPRIGEMIEYCYNRKDKLKPFDNKNISEIQKIIYDVDDSNNFEGITLVIDF